MRRLASVSLLAAALLLAPPASAAPNVPKPAPAAKPQNRPPQKPLARPGQPQKGKKPGKNDAKKGPDEGVRRSIAGGPTADDAQKGAESPELKQLRDIERELFAPAAPRPGAPFPSELSHPLPIDPDRPSVRSSGLPAAFEPRSAAEPTIEKEPSLAWIKQLKSPDWQVRWDERVVRYLQFFRDDPRGRGMAAYGHRRAGRYRDVIKSALRAEKIPEALLWVAFVESGFDPTIKSHAGAAGLFQFMPDGARIYGLRVDRWVDERLDPALVTGAAAKYLSDLHRRFGSWEMALAAYNMGYGGLLAAVRKYNTNDFWELSRFEAGIPWETTLYVPKIIAMAVVAENPEVFGLAGTEPDAALAFDTVRAQGGTSLAALSRASGVPEPDLEQLNPQLRARRTPPDGPGSMPLEYVLRLPRGKADERLSQRLLDEVAREPRLARYTVRFGQTLEHVASEVGSTRAKVAELNGMNRDDVPRAGDVLLVPDGPRREQPAERPVIVAPQGPASLEGRARVFYRIIPGDTLAQIARALRVGEADLITWNSLDPAIRLQEGLVLQAFVDPAHDLSTVVVIREQDARVLTVGTEEFFAHFESQKGRRRITVTVGKDDTWKTLSKKYGISVGMLERINRRARSEPLKPGEKLVVYTGKTTADGKPDDGPGPALVAPHPEDLPALPDDAPTP